MPNPNKGENREDFVSRCVKDPEVRSQPGVADADDPNKAAVGRCEGIFDAHAKKEREKKQSAEAPAASLKRNPLPESPEWHQALAKSDKIGVDRDKKVIYGRVVAQEGPFKSEGRGEFDKQALRSIKKLMDAKPNGLKSRFQHPTMSDDGLGKFLGRDKNPRIDTIMKPLGDGTFKEIAVVRSDLHLDPSSFTTPYGSLGTYVMDLAENDPDAFSSSLVLKTDKEYRLDPKGRPLTDEAGEPLPPLWRPKELHAIDVVDTGDAVDGFLSAGGIDSLPDAVLRRGAELLDKQFPGASRETIKSRCLAWLDKYLNLKFGEEPGKTAPLTAENEKKLRESWAQYIRERANGDGVLVMEGGMKYKLSAVDPADEPTELEDDGDEDEALKLLLELGE